MFYIYIYIYIYILESEYEKEGSFAVNPNIQDINALINSETKEIYTVVKVRPGLSEICNDLLKSEQNSSLPMLNLPPPLCTETSTYKNASNIIIGSGCESDICLDEYNKEILSIFEYF